MQRAAFFLAGLATALAGCTVGPNYAAPQSAIPPVYGEPQPTAIDGTTAAADPAHWWTVFGDPELTSLVERALAGSPSIELAASRVRQARLQEIAARGIGLPTVDAMANATDVRFSKNAGFSSIARAIGGQTGSGAGDGSGSGDGSGTGSGSGSSGGVALPGSSIATFALGFDASWELDLFGRGARTREAALANSEAAVWNGRDAAVTLTAEVADAYFAYRLDQAQIAILCDELANQQRAVELVAHRAQTGLVPAIEAVRQRDAVTTTQARLLPLEADARVRVHALGTLIGKGPEEVSDELARPLPALGPAPAIPAGLPSDLLRRRPDIRAAERRIAAASAQIGVATADLYPRFSLTGLAELISTNLATLFQGDSLQTTASGAAMFPILDWGRRKATVREREEDRTQAYLQYQQTVLTALRDVEDALVRIDRERARHAVLERALADADSSARAVESQRRAGLVAQDPVLGAQVKVLQAREQLATSSAQLRQQTVALFKALGEGWSDTDARPDAGTGAAAVQPQAATTPAGT